VGRLRRHPWFLALLIWTGLLALAILPRVPGATRPFPPCNYQGSTFQDPALPTCPMDMFNVDALFVFLVVALWIVGVIVGCAAFAVSRLGRWLAHRRSSTSPQS
jgi:hypothetical protein